MNINDEELQMISLLAQKQVGIEKSIALLEDQLKEKSDELKQVREKDLPNAMQEIGLSEFKLEDGTKISIKQNVFASIPKEDGGRAFSWLREHDFGGLIKNEIITSFGKGEDADALRAATVLAEAGFHPVQKESVHPSTLKAFVNEQMKAGNELPLETFGVFTVVQSKVELKK